MQISDEHFLSKCSPKPGGKVSSVAWDPNMPFLFSSFSSYCSLGIYHIYSHMVWFFFVLVSALFLVKNESVTKILTMFSILLLCNLHFCFTRVWINTLRRDQTLFILPTLQTVISLSLNVYLVFVLLIYVLNIYIFNCFLISPPRRLVSALFLSNPIFYSTLFHHTSQFFQCLFYKK